MTAQSNKYRWFVIISICFIQAVASMVLLSPVTIISEISRTIGTDFGETSAITMVAGSIFVIITSFFGGKLIDKVGAYIILVGCSALFITASILVLFIGGNYLGLIFIRFIQGCGAGPILASLPLVVTQWSEKKERGMIFGIQGVIISIGSAAITSYVPFVFQRTGSWQTSLFSVAFFGVLALVLSLIVFFGPRPPVEHSISQNDKISPVSGTNKKAILPPFTWAILLCIFWFAWMVRIFYDLIPSYLIMEQPAGAGINLIKAGALLSLMHVMTIIGLLSSGIILEAVFRGRPKKLIMIAFCVPTVSWYLMKFQYVFSNMMILTPLMLAGGIALSFINPMVMTFVTKNYPERIMGRLGGMLMMASNFGTLMGLALASYMIKVNGTFSITLALVGIGGALGFISSFFLKEHNKDVKTETE